MSRCAARTPGERPSRRATLFEAAVIANAAAGVVVGKVGTATADADELRERLPEALAAAEEVR